MRRFYRGRGQGSNQVEAAARPPVQGVVTGKKDPVFADFRELCSLKGRLERSQFVVEGVRLTARALDDGLPVLQLLYTPALTSSLEGMELLNRAYRAGIPHYRVSDGVLGAVTSTRPIPPVLAAVYAEYRDAVDLAGMPGRVLLITDSIANPNNLGMLLRTADAAGVEGIIVMGEGASPFHKECIRAARGAVGRIPIHQCRHAEEYLASLCRDGFTLLGASAHASCEPYSCAFTQPVAFLVGNETDGIRPPLLRHCTERVRIPMAPGQSSLNVGVAAGVLFYELVRRQTAG